jgi:hypothetical protein
MQENMDMGKQDRQGAVG